MSATRPPHAPWVVPGDGGASFEVVHPSGHPSPVVAHVPHAACAIPDDVRAGIVLDDAALTAELLRLTDHRTDVLAADANRLGATSFVNRLSRLVVDPERFPDPDREVMERRGMGAVYTRTTGRDRLRDDDAALRGELIGRYFEPYAAAFAEVVAHHLDVHGACLIVDVHSYPSRRLPYEIGGESRPDVCIGTDTAHTPVWLRELVAEAARKRDLGFDLDTPFSGVYVPLDRYQRDERVTAVMLEIRRDLYLDEATAQPHEGEARMRSFVADVIGGCASR